MQKREGSICRNLDYFAPREGGQDDWKRGQHCWNKQKVKLKKKGDENYCALQFKSLKNEEPFPLDARITKAIISICKELGPEEIQEQSHKPVSDKILNKISRILEIT